MSLTFAYDPATGLPVTASDGLGTTFNTDPRGTTSLLSWLALLPTRWADVAAAMQAEYLQAVKANTWWKGPLATEVSTDPAGLGLAAHVTAKDAASVYALLSAPNQVVQLPYIPIVDTVAFLISINVAVNQDIAANPTPVASPVAGVSFSAAARATWTSIFQTVITALQILASTGATTVQRVNSTVQAVLGAIQTEGLATPGSYAAFGTVTESRLTALGLANRTDGLSGVDNAGCVTLAMGW